MAKPKRIQHPQKRAFLAAYSELGNVTQSARIAGICRDLHYDWLGKDEVYAAEFKIAKSMAGDALEDEARHRAVEGVAEPKFWEGRVCGFVQRYSDGLLTTLLKGAKPQVYREHLSHEISGPDGKPVEVKVDLSGLSEEELDQLELLSRKASGSGRDSSGAGAKGAGADTSED